MESKQDRAIGNEFLKWLIKSRNLKRRSAKDVVSHLRRAGILININNLDLEVDDMVFLMSKSPVFKSLGANSKSHLRRAVRLYREFINEFNSKININLFD